MAAGFQIASLALAAASAGQQKRAADKQASAQKTQSIIAAQEAERAAKIQEKENKEFERKQRLQFLKSGVRLEGTPLQVLAESEMEGSQEIEALRRSGLAKSRLLSKRADITSRSGTASAVGTTAGAVGNFAKFSAKQPESTTNNTTNITNNYNGGGRSRGRGR